MDLHIFCYQVNHNQCERLYLKAAEYAELTGDEVVFIGCELQPPTIELEVESHRHAVGFHRDWPEVARPGVVSVNVNDADAVAVGQMRQFAAHEVGLRSGNNQRLVIADGFGDAHIASFHLVEHIVPVGVGVRPCNQHGVLFSPFGGQGDVWLCCVQCRVDVFMLICIQS